MAKKLSSSEIAAKAAEIAAPIFERGGLSVWDAEFKKEGADWFLRLYADKEGGVAISDLESVNEELNEAIDREDMVAGPYILELSSAGVERSLKLPRHFEASVGKNAAVKLYAAGSDGVRSFEGRITEISADETVSFECGGALRIVPFSNIASAKLTFEQ